MLSLKHIITSTAISILFGIYSIYNVIEYVKLNDKNANIKITKLSNRIDNLNEKMIELNIKYHNICEAYVTAKDEIRELNKALNALRSTLNKNEEVSLKSDENMCDVVVVNEPIICDEICDAANALKHSKQTMMSIADDNMYESVSVSSVELSDNSSIVSTRNRTPSLSEINWLGLTKKLFFG